LIEVTYASEEERQIQLQFDEERRIKLLQIITRLAFYLFGPGLAVVLIIAFSLSALPMVFAILIEAAIVVPLSYYGQRFAKQMLANRAAICVILAFLVTLFSFQLQAYFVAPVLSDESVYVFGSYAVAIILAGLVASRPLFLTTIVAAVVLTTIASLLSHTAPLAAWVITNIQLVAVSVLMYFFAEGLRATLIKLGDTRVAYERAKQLDDIKDQFIASVNHELRTPIMALQGFIDLYLLSDELPLADRTSLIVEAQEVTVSLVALLESILEVRRMDQGARNFESEAVHVRDALDSALHLIDPREGKQIERELRVDMAQSLAIWGESIRLRQILANLISNAMKYSKPGSPIDIAAQVVSRIEPIKDRRGETKIVRLIEITVRDYGLGVPPAQIPLLFQRFMRLPRDLASTTVGNGLGLYLCRIFTESMGGAIGVESSGIEGEGSLFFLQLPLPPGDALAASMLGSGTPARRPTPLLLTQ